MTSLKNTRLITPFLFLLSLFAFGGTTLGCTADAHARYSSSRHAQVDFDDLYVTSERGRVVVEYEISRRGWNRLQRAGINPRLDLYLPTNSRSGRYNYHGGRSVTQRRGTVVFHGAHLGRAHRHVQIDLSTPRGRSHRGRSGYSRGSSQRVEVAVARPAPRRHARPQPRRSNRSRSSITIRLGF